MVSLGKKNFLGFESWADRQLMVERLLFNRLNVSKYASISIWSIECIYVVLQRSLWHLYVVPVMSGSSCNSLTLLLAFYGTFSWAVMSGSSFCLLSYRSYHQNEDIKAISTYQTCVYVYMNM